MTVEIVDRVDPDREQQAWDLYQSAFTGVNALAVQRHLMYRTEFDDVMGDKRVQKYLYIPDGSPDGRVAGVSTFTNDLDSMTLISPAYFERRWPDLYSTRRIFYCGFVAVDPAHQSTAAFGQMVAAMYHTAADANGIIILDICSHNEDQRSLHQVIPLMLKRLARPQGRSVIATRLDTQTYWEYEFPRATA